MYLENASTIEEILTFGVKPCLEFAEILDDSELDLSEREEIIFTELKGKLFGIRQALERMKRV